MGPGPVIGGKAGDQDYSLSSMLEHAPIKKQAEPGEAPSPRSAVSLAQFGLHRAKTPGPGVFLSSHKS